MTSRLEEPKREEEEDNSWEVVSTYASNDEENTAPSPTHSHPKSTPTLEVINTKHDYVESIDEYSFVIDSPTNMVSSSKGKDIKEAKNSSCSHLDRNLDDKTLQKQEIYFNPIFPSPGERRRRRRIRQFELDSDESVSTLHKEEDEAIIGEINHLQKRISNVRQNIQLSSTSLQSPSNWEQNCLNAVKNCVVEWKAILSTYQPATDPSFVENTLDHLEDDLSYDSMQLHPLHPDSEQSKAIALDLFGLLQLAMQCGPLSGSNAGYFKRCGGAVALTAHMFLTGCVEGDVTQQLRFTERQQHAIRKWVVASKKAAEVNNDPSKSVLKLQQKAVRAKKSARKKKGKNQ